MNSGVKHLRRSAANLKIYINKHGQQKLVTTSKTTFFNTTPRQWEENKRNERLAVEQINLNLNRH